ncbi:TOBE domain-containing protein [Galbitalea soli]|uniref:MerR family transcriptional regulator n=1 Tax=Galbitalea soli TaxID=1268042 RepID=A0A7C9TR44_9MICO|nr:TOBE domain-containing protein [Galbitalea soli]NEM90763.1 MerR family transcriptional regulator [Galbitalea soli]NYJ31481.1 molybdopterin-binding protein [Galbitalea soli]
MSNRIRVSEAAALVGVSDDTIRRWAEAGRLALSAPEDGPRTVDGAELAHLMQELAADGVASSTPAHTSARNQLRGIVTRVTKDTVMAQVELQAGPFRIVSLISREAVDELGLEVGTVASASVKATSVSVSLA